MVQLCRQLDAGLVLLGDAFNVSHPDSESVRIFREGIAAIRERGLPVWAIQGQHDASNPPWPLALTDGITYVHQQEFQPWANGPIFYGLDQHRDQAKLEQACRAIPAAATILVAHQLARPAFTMDGVWDFDPDWVPAHVQLMILGDYHQAEQFNLPDGRWLGYSGSTYRCKLDEDKSGTIFCMELAPNSNCGVKMSRIQLKTRQVHRFAIHTDAELQKAVQEVQALPKTFEMLPIVHLRYYTSVEGVVERISQVLQDRAYLWLDPAVMRLAGEEKSLPGLAAGEACTVDNCVAKLQTPGSDPYSLVMELLQQDPDMTLPKWREKYLGVKNAAA